MIIDTGKTAAASKSAYKLANNKPLKALEDLAAASGGPTVAKERGSAVPAVAETAKPSVPYGRAESAAIQWQLTYA